jgi:hypothetical protein
MNFHEINSTFKYTSFIQFLRLWWAAGDQASQFIDECIHFIPTILFTFISTRSKTWEHSKFSFVPTNVSQIWAKL